MQTSIILIAALIVFTILGILLFLKMRSVDQIKRKLEEDEKQKIDQLQNINNHVSNQLQQLTHHFQSELTRMQGNINSSSSDLTSNIQKQMSSMTQSLDTRLNKATESLEKVSETHVKLAQETKSIQNIGKDIAELQRVLKAPKLRGILGELNLENLLAQVYPKDGYILQYSFKNGVIADAVLKLKDNKLLVIDSKFAYSKFGEILKSQEPEERKRLKKQFMQDIQKHITSIAHKYILPDEGTLDFALMYIPAENIYYETIISDRGEKNILDFAYKNKVFPVSPNTLYAYLTTIAMGLRGLEINKKAQEIISHLGRVSIEYNKFVKDFDVLGGHIGKARSKYEDSTRRLSRLTDKMDSIQNLKVGIKKPVKNELAENIVLEKDNEKGVDKFDK